MVITEQVLRNSRRGSSFRPFSSQVNVSPRGYSMPLQRAMTDFGCERSFAKATHALYEHDGVDIAQSAERFFTLKHAKRIPPEPIVRTIPSKGASWVITQSDGSFVPIVAFKPGEGDKRKLRTKQYKEVRLCAATEHKSTTKYYANGGFCDVYRTGNGLARTALRAGWNSHCEVHCVSDGAPWIANQAQLQFGDDCFLLDYYHLCEYLQPAAIKCDPNAPEQWMNRQRELLKQSKSQEVLHTLSMNIETDGTLPDDKAPVRCAHRYMNNRINQLDYKSAIEKGLPIGSGIIESAQGHIIQERMKKSGAAWDMQNADAMISLRVLRANQQWNQYWKN